MNSTAYPARVECTPPAIDDFPMGLFSQEQRANGAIVIHITVSLYLFVALAVVCDKFFVPAVDRICQALNMSNDVAGATFMAAATSAPELFVNVIGTFITEGDIGIGTIVGSAVFNILAVAACCGIGAGMAVPLDWWPLTRDCLAYGITVSILICIIHDEIVEWYEALCLVLLYGIYICVMYFDKAFQKCARSSCKHVRRPTKATEEKESDAINVDKTGAKLQTVKIEQIAQEHQHNGIIKNAANSLVLPTKSNELILDNSKKRINVPTQDDICDEKINRHETAKDYLPDNLEITNEKQEIEITNEKQEIEEKGLDDYVHNLWKWPKDRSHFTKIAWIITWPIHLVFMFTIPDCEKPRFQNWFPLTFVMCIVWIGSLSYIVAWMITIIGDTLKIPDSVMGITFLAAGTSVPEAVSSVIVAKQGHGSMGISNSIGSNTFDILLCLGLPWLIKASLATKVPDSNGVKINSMGLEYSAISLLSTLLMLYVTFWFNNFRLDAKVGRACLCMYGMFLVLASLIELNVFFQVNAPTCGR